MATTQCLACLHPDRKQMENCLAAGESVRKVAVKFGLDRNTVDRHNRKHLIPRIQKQVSQEIAKTEELHIEKVASTWGTRLESTYTRAIANHERLVGNEKHESTAAGYLGTALKACDAGLRASGEIGSTGTTINVAQMLVMPTQSQLPGTPARQIESADIIDADEDDAEPVP